jgi:hypothetical protein
MDFEETPAGRVPIEAVEVYCDACGSPYGHTFVYTDADGLYSFSWVNNGVETLLGEDARLQRRERGFGAQRRNRQVFATVNGNTRFDIELARR